VRWFSGALARRLASLSSELTRQLRSLYESVARRRADIINERLTANVRQLEQARFPLRHHMLAPLCLCKTLMCASSCAQLKHELEDGCEREAQAQARVLAEEERCERCNIAAPG
jgi:hypothetical protein